MTALRSPGELDGELDENETQGFNYEALELPLSVGIVESPLVGGRSVACDTRTNRSKMGLCRRC